MNANNDRRARLQQKQTADANRSKGNNFSVLDTGDWDLPWFKIEPDETYVFDIIPYEVTSKKHPRYDEIAKTDLMEDYVLEVLVHTNIGPSKASVVCPKNYGKSCEICDEHDRVLEEKKAEYKEKGLEERKAWSDEDVYALRAKRKAFFVIRDRLDKDTLKLWQYSAAWSLDNIVKKANRKKVLLGNMIFDGLSLEIIPEANKQNKKYAGEITDIDFVKEDAFDYTEEDIAGAPKLDTMLITKTAKEIHNLLWGNTDDEDEDEVEETKEEAPSRRRGRDEEAKPSRRRTREKEEEEVDSEDDAEEETPSRGRRRTREKEEESLECPEGLTFGDDIDSKKCIGKECDLYDSCDSAYNEKYPNG